MAELRMAIQKWFTRYQFTECATEPPNGVSLTFTTHRIRAWEFTYTPAAANNWMEAVYPIPHYADLNLPWMYRIYGTANEDDGDKQVVMGVNITSSSIAATNDPPLGTWAKMTLDNRSPANLIWGGDTTDSSPWLKGKPVTVANTPSNGDLAFIQVKRFNQDTADNFDHSWYFIGLRLWIPVRDQYALESVETI